MEIQRMSLQITARKRLEYFDLDVDFTCPDESTLIMIGPSGGGKTTIIRMIAGLEKPDEGRITYRGETWFDSTRGICLPPQQRRLGYVFQEYILFPHLTIFENAAFAAVDKTAVDGLLELFGIAHLSDRKPYLVSGGERQRCALCQALARQPQVMLLDEPFSALDVVTRRSLREQLHTIKGKLSVPILYVTHDIGEALRLADEIVPIVNGKVEKRWLQRTITSVPGRHADVPKAARQLRLALATD
jgi:molybdate transport system ATP-binding protein